MKYSGSKLQPRLFIVFVSWAVLFQLNCAEPTPQEQARRVLQDAAEAMGGLEALRNIENIYREGHAQRSSLGQARVTSERILVGSPSPYKRIVDFTVPRELNLSGPTEIIQVADAKKGGYRSVQGRALRPLEPGQMDRYQIEWDRDIAKFLVHALGEESTIEGYDQTVNETAIGEYPHHVVDVRLSDGILYKVYIHEGTGLISELEFTEDRNPYGDLKKERIFSNYL